MILKDLPIGTVVTDKKTKFKLPHPKNIKRVTESVHNSTLIY